MYYIVIVVYGSANMVLRNEHAIKVFLDSYSYKTVMSFFIVFKGNRTWVDVI